MTVLNQDVVGYVHHVVNWPDAGVPQADLQPQGAVLNVDVFDHPQLVSRRQLLVGDGRLDQVGSPFGAVFNHFMAGEAIVQVVNGGQVVDVTVN